MIAPHSLSFNDIADLTWSPYCSRFSRRFQQKINKMNIMASHTCRKPLLHIAYREKHTTIDESPIFHAHRLTFIPKKLSFQRWLSSSATVDILPVCFLYFWFIADCWLFQQKPVIEMIKLNFFEFSFYLFSLLKLFLFLSDIAIV